MVANVVMGPLPAVVPATTAQEAMSHAAFDEVLGRDATLVDRRRKQTTNGRSQSGIAGSRTYWVTIRHVLLWTNEEGKDRQEEPHFVVLTRTMVLHAEVHDRTPVMLTPDDARAWADPEAPEQEVAALLGSRRDDVLVMREVESGAENRGNGLEVAAAKELWPWEV